MRWLVLVMALVAPNDGNAQAWWQGIWAQEPEMCGFASRIGSSTKAPIAITDSKILEYQLSCTINKARVMNELGAVQLYLSCQSQGDSWETEYLLLRPYEEASDILIWYGGSAPVAFQRCLFEPG